MKKLLYLIPFLASSLFAAGYNVADGLVQVSSTGTIPTVLIDTATIQKRISATCAAGSSIRVIDVDGTVTCETDDTGTGGGGASTLAVATGSSSGWTGTATSSPTAVINASSDSFRVTLTGSSTAFLQLREPRSMPYMYILDVASATTSSSTLMNVDAISHTVPAGATCQFNIYVVFRTSATSTGITLAVSTTSASYARFAGMVDIPIAADGSAGGFQGQIRLGDEFVRGTGVETANTVDNLAQIQGVFVAASGTPNTLTLRFNSEIAGSAARVMPGTMGYFYNWNQN